LGASDCPADAIRPFTRWLGVPPVIKGLVKRGEQAKQKATIAKPFGTAFPVCERSRLPVNFGATRLPR
jgi:hypothetical protein